MILQMKQKTKFWKIAHAPLIQGPPKQIIYLDPIHVCSISLSKKESDSRAMHPARPQHILFDMIHSWISLTWHNYWAHKLNQVSSCRLSRNILCLGMWKMYHYTSYPNPYKWQNVNIYMARLTRQNYVEFFPRTASFTHFVSSCTRYMSSSTPYMSSLQRYISSFTLCASSFTLYASSFHSLCRTCKNKTARKKITSRKKKSRPEKKSRRVSGDPWN